LKELSRAICAFIATPSLPLPDDLNRVIEAYLQKHEKFDEGSSDRLQDELQSIYQKQVKDLPNQHAAFISILRSLVPVFRTPARILKWWDILSAPILDSLSQDKTLLAECSGALLDILTFSTPELDQAGTDVSPSPIADRLLLAWMGKCEESPSESGVTLQTSEQRIRSVLVQYGKKRPKVGS
jgi:hypothetical protein